MIGVWGIRDNELGSSDDSAMAEAGPAAVNLPQCSGGCHYFTEAATV